MTKIAPKKIENVGLIFLDAIFVIPPPPLQSSQDPQICDIESSSIIFGNLLVAISNLQVPQLRWEGGVTEIAAKKIGNIGRKLKRTFILWMRQVNRRQAAWPSRSTDLAGRPAAWTRLKAELSVLGKNF